jgi:hypothetical protein
MDVASVNAIMEKEQVWPAVIRFVHGKRVDTKEYNRLYQEDFDRSEFLRFYRPPGFDVFKLENGKYVRRGR